MVTPVTLPDAPDWIEAVKQRAHDNMRDHHSCTQCIVEAFMEVLGMNEPMVIRAAGAFHGGMTSSLTCGVHTAGLMVLGLLIGREKIELGLDGLMPIMTPAQDLIKRLDKRLGSSSCKELTDVDFTDAEQAIHFVVTNAIAKCHDRVRDGAEEIALFLKELEESGMLFRHDG
jgi:C_GCAxxG_C_C family probable redox protein